MPTDSDADILLKSDASSPPKISLLLISASLLADMVFRERGTINNGALRDVYNSDGSDPPKEEIERSRGCNYYCGDCHALTFAHASDPDAPQGDAEPEWSRLDFGREASALMQRTGHTLTSLQAGGRLLLFGGRNMQRPDGAGNGSSNSSAATPAADSAWAPPSVSVPCAGDSPPSLGLPGLPYGGPPAPSPCCTNDAWILELRSDSQPPLLRELVATGPPPSPRAHHTATLLGDTLYVLGGLCEFQRAGEVPLRDVHVLHLPTARWSSPQAVHGNAPAILARHTTAALNGKLWISGGLFEAHRCRHRQRQR